MDRSINFLKDGHFLSGFQQLSAQSNQFTALRQIELEIQKIRRNIISQAENNQQLTQIQKNAYLLQQRVLHEQKYIQQRLQLLQKQQVLLKLQCSVMDSENQLKLENEVLEIYNFLIDLIQEFINIQKVVESHISNIHLANQLLSTGTQVDKYDYQSQINQLQSLVGAISKLKQIENYQIVILQNNSIDFGNILNQMVQQLKKQIQEQLLEPILQLWCQVVISKLGDIGRLFLQTSQQQLQQIFYDKVQIISAVQQFDFGNKIINEFLVNFVSAQKSTELEEEIPIFDFHIQTFQQILNLSEAIGYKDQLESKLQVKWKNSFVKLKPGRQSDELPYLFGYFIVLNELQQSFKPNFIQQMSQTLSDNLIVFCQEMMTFNYSDSQNIIRSILNDLYQFQDFVQKLKHYLNYNITTIQAAVNKQWIQLFCRQLDQQYIESFFQEVQAAIEKIKLPNENWHEHAQDLFVSLSHQKVQFTQNITYLFMNYLDYIMIWLGKGLIQSPKLEQFLQLSIQMPKQINVQSFTTILEAFNELFMLIVQRFDQFFTQCTNYFLFLKYFVLFSCIIPSLRIAQCYIQNGTYFDSSNIFHELLDIAKDRLQKYYQNLNLQFENLVTYSILSGSICSSTNQQIRVQSTLFSEKVIDLTVKMLQFNCDIFNGFNIQQYVHQFYDIAKHCLIYCLKQMKQNTIDYNLFCQFNNNINLFKEVKFKQQQYQINEYNIIERQLVNVDPKIQQIINQYYGIQKKQQVNPKTKVFNLQINEEQFTVQQIEAICQWKFTQFILQYEEVLVLEYKSNNQEENKAYQAILCAFNLSQAEVDPPPQKNLYQVLKGTGQFKKSIDRLKSD